MTLRARASSFDEDLQDLLGKLCVDKGFCLMGDAAEDVVTRESFDAESFALAVLRADGFKNPEHETKWRKIISQEFTEWFGSSAASVRDYSEKA